MKKYLICWMLITLFALVGCKDNGSDVISKESESYNETKSNDENSKEANRAEEKPADKNANINSLLPEDQDYVNLEELFSKRWRETYESPELIPVDTLYDESLYKTIWYVHKELEGCSLMFFEDGRYLFALNRFGNHIIGHYEIMDAQTIKLIPTVFPKEGAIYPEYCDQMLLLLKRDPENIKYSDLLICEGTGEVFYSLFSHTKAGAECLVDGYEVIKMDCTDFIITNKTGLKEKPEMNSDNKKITFTYSADYYHANPDILLEEYTFEELNLLFENLDEFLKGMGVTALARTKDKFQIGGISDYWYYVSYYYFEGTFYEGWIYGGDLNVIDESKIEDYLEMLKNEIDSLL